MQIAVEGCCHGELDNIYGTLQLLEKREQTKIDLLICCGDFQASTENITLSVTQLAGQHVIMQACCQLPASQCIQGPCASARLQPGMHKHSQMKCSLVCNLEVHEAVEQLHDRACLHA